MAEQSRTLELVLAGAVVGGFVSYLYLTDPGRRLRHNAEGWLDDLLDGMIRMQASVTKAQRAVEEGRHSWEAVLHLARPSGGRTPRQGSS